MLWCGALLTAQTVRKPLAIAETTHQHSTIPTSNISVWRCELQPTQPFAVRRWQQQIDSWVRCTDHDIASLLSTGRNTMGSHFRQEVKVVGCVWRQNSEKTKRESIHHSVHSQFTLLLYCSRNEKDYFHQQSFWKQNREVWEKRVRMAVVWLLDLFLQSTFQMATWSCSGLNRSSHHLWLWQRPSGDEERRRWQRPNRSFIWIQI